MLSVVRVEHVETYKGPFVADYYEHMPQLRRESHPNPRNDKSLSEHFYSAFSCACRDLRQASHWFGCQKTLEVLTRRGYVLREYEGPSPDVVVHGETQALVKRCEAVLVRTAPLAVIPVIYNDWGELYDRMEEAFEDGREAMAELVLFVDVQVSVEV